jgi:hypothetical protein
MKKWKLEGRDKQSQTKQATSLPHQRAHFLLPLFPFQLHLPSNTNSLIASKLKVIFRMIFKICTLFTNCIRIHYYAESYLISRSRYVMVARQKYSIKMSQKVMQNFMAHNHAIQSYTRISLSFIYLSISLKCPKQLLSEGKMQTKCPNSLQEYILRK